MTKLYLGSYFELEPKLNPDRQESRQWQDQHIKMTKSMARVFHTAKKSVSIGDEDSRATVRERVVHSGEKQEKARGNFRAADQERRISNLVDYRQNNLLSELTDRDWTRSRQSNSQCVQDMS
jgi:hypothetical protein